MNQAYKQLDKEDFEKVKNAKDILTKKEDSGGVFYEKAVVDNLLASLLNH
ncbi:hypothetical protein [Telluribacter sp.]|jgi:hypothetical protein|nr:hypothetical protein [Telluribacter sp.]